MNNYRYLNCIALLVCICCTLAYNWFVVVVGSSSPSRRGSFGQHFEDAMNIEATSSSLNDGGSSSKTDLHHTGWTSSDDDADTMDQDEEGASLDLFSCSIMHLS